MTYNEVSDFLKKVTYKPDFKIESERRHDALEIRLIKYVPDVKDPSVIIPLVFQKRIEERYISHCREQEFAEVLFDNILAFEKHEATEWFKINGVCFREPHPELGGF